MVLPFRLYPNAGILCLHHSIRHEPGRCVLFLHVHESTIHVQASGGWNSPGCGVYSACCLASAVLFYWLHQGSSVLCLSRWCGINVSLAFPITLPVTFISVFIAMAMASIWRGSHSSWILCAVLCSSGIRVRRRAQRRPLMKLPWPMSQL